MLNIVDKLNEISNNFKEWIIKNGNDPYIWILFVVIGILVFYIAYHALQKEK